MHRGFPSFSFKYPGYYYDVPEGERERRVQIDEDLCRIEPDLEEADDIAIFCIRVILEIPIKGATEPFSWGVWVTQSEDSFEKYAQTFGDDQSSLGSFGWLAVDMPFYKNTNSAMAVDHLECDIQWGNVGQRPKAYLWENDHQLVHDQRNGISWRKATKIANLANQAFLGIGHGK